MSPASALQRQEPGDPRAKVIEAMAATLVGVLGTIPDAQAREGFFDDMFWRSLSARVLDSALAALEQEGWGLTSAREAERLREYPVWVCRERSCEHYGTTGRAVCSDRGHQRPERFVPIAEVERLRTLLAEAVPWLDHEPDEGRELGQRIEAALSSVPVEEEGSNGCDLLPRWGEFHDSPGGPLYAVHDNGLIYAIFAGPQQALEYQRGLDGIARRYFHIENAAGERLTLTEHRPGHAHAILDTLNRKAVEGDSTNG